MKVRNTTNSRDYLLRAGKERILVKAGEVKEVPEEFLNDSVFIFALGSGRLVKVEEQEEKPEEVVSIEEPVKEEVQKTRRKKSDEE